jgi:predicted CoA-binding protein
MSVDHKDILKRAKAILLVDWPNPEVPKSLLRAGFTVFGYSPGKYSAISQTENGELVFSQLSKQPASVDIVNVYRPEAEHAAIINNHVLPLKAKVLWLHPPVMSANTAALASTHNLIFVERSDIAEVARSISGD